MAKVYPETPDAPRCLAPSADVAPPSFEIPHLACDTHAHVVSDDPDAYPVVPSRSYTPVPSPESAYLGMLAATGMTRGVLVQISVYGTDNRYMLEVLARHPGRLRGVAVAAPDVSERELARMHDAGVRGLRLNVLFGGGVSLDAMETLAARIGPMGWHLQLLLDARQLPELMPRVRKLTLPVVVDHMGHMPVSLGMSHPGFQALRHLVADHGWWTKLSGAYRTGTRPGFDDVTPWAQALIEAGPDRVVWGSDWPHVAVADMPDTGALRNLLAKWAPDAAMRHRILVANPQRLYDFPEA
ncbi:amidohydrolase family protein [Cupriavidus plantarum]|uniref:amidohydrolase family protein n=1 Tax=Cupriavidus plantarum TaxID=942865 RepID=UPI001B0620D6|nr:amidohydrolase family protein [Cupriavidus plantarum]CAG2147203.1 4-sulfomuconolactone hydrolase [Cupriavidus plantarum]SMR85620.1 Predicted metal-dependent hydrolase, TIM-barrel fold [Cupriavidus plantarum]